MKVIKNEDVVYFDVDQTLILYEGTPGAENEPVALVLDPLRNRRIEFKEHSAMVRLLKEANQRGSFVVVWSRGGWEWATNVVEALQLTPYVNQVMTKPLVYFDDKDVKEWLIYRVYLEPGTRYKQHAED